MKKAIFFIVVLLLATMGVSAAPYESGTMPISVTVDGYLAITVPTFTPTNINAAEETVLTPNGKLKIISNIDKWYIAVSSQNGGYVKKQASPTGPVLAQLKYTIDIETLLNDVQLTANQYSADQGPTLLAGNEYNIKLRFGPAPDFISAGTYTDTITITLSVH